MNQLLAIVFASSAVMAAVGWIMQFIVYPGFADVRPDRWTSFHGRHVAAIGPIVVPAMLFEAGGALLVAWHASLPASLGLFPGAAVPGGAPAAWVGFVLAALALGDTLVRTGPQHGPLARAQDPDRIGRLVKMNLPRTVFWTAHAFLAGWMVLAFSG